jgi:hypothetical protein
MTVSINGNGTLTGANLSVTGTAALPATTATSLSGLSTPLPVLSGGTGDTGSAWSIMSTGAITSSTGTITSASGVTHYKIIGKTVFVEIIITVTNNGTAPAVGAAGSLNVASALPVATLQSSIISGRENAINGYGGLFACTVGTTSGAAVRYDNTYPAGTGAILIYCGCYESV